MGRARSEEKRASIILPLFSPAFFDIWQIIIPRERLVTYIREREP